MRDQFICATVKYFAVLAAIGVGGFFCTACVAASDTQSPVMRQFKADKRYLNFPVKTGVPKRYVDILVDGAVAREFEIELAGVSETPDFWVFLDVDEFKGKTLVLRPVNQSEADAEIFSAVTLDDAIRDSEVMYRETLRPQFHFTSRRGWINDTNGLVYYKGQYHLFYQHNPYGWNWGNMTWGHAMSVDMVRWMEMPDALHPDTLGTMYSGSAVVDWNNTSGFQSGSEKPLVCMYTCAGGNNILSKGKPFTQSIAYSADGGKTWTKYEHNPVLGHIAAENRDPKVIWHDQTRQWIMALYLDDSAYALYASKDLKDWKKVCDVDMPGCSECPDFFPLCVDGDKDKTRWVFWAANGNYMPGDFDGRGFVRAGDVQSCYTGTSAYAGQTWSDIPAGDGRRIHCAWLRQEMPGMPFNQMLTFPVELTLRTTQDGLRIFAMPIREIATLHDKAYVFKEADFAQGSDPLEKVDSELLHVRGVFSTGAAGICGFNINGVAVTCDLALQELVCLNLKTKLTPVDNQIKLEILVDRTSIEIFANDGMVYMPIGHIMTGGTKSLKVIRTGDAKILNMEIYELKSAWEKVND